MYVFDNEAPELHRDAIEASNSKYQLVTPNNHRRDVFERAIRTCKENFIRMLIRNRCQISNVNVGPYH